ncbi:hypothetical protein Tco_1396010 [Tanacetum coccineum]
MLRTSGHIFLFGIRGHQPHRHYGLAPSGGKSPVNELGRFQSLCTLQWEVYFTMTSIIGRGTPARMAHPTSSGSQRSGHPLFLHKQLPLLAVAQGYGLLGTRILLTGSLPSSHRKPSIQAQSPDTCTRVLPKIGHDSHSLKIYMVAYGWKVRTSPRRPLMLLWAYLLSWAYGPWTAVMGGRSRHMDLRVTDTGDWAYGSKGRHLWTKHKSSIT